MKKVNLAISLWNLYHFDLGKEARGDRQERESDSGSAFTGLPILILRSVSKGCGVGWFLTTSFPYFPKTSEANSFSTSGASVSAQEILIPCCLSFHASSIKEARAIKYQSNLLSVASPQETERKQGKAVVRAYSALPALEAARRAFLVVKWSMKVGQKYALFKKKT